MLKRDNNNHISSSFNFMKRFLCKDYPVAYNKKLKTLTPEMKSDFQETSPVDLYIADVNREKKSDQSLDSL